MKPRIFVSSTIIDFEDLRGGIKYYLEEFGYEVQMSEYPNFKIDTDKSKFEICLKNLQSCQYFILLIGYRRGGWYEPNKLSITHKEYLAAKSLIESGHPLRIISFIRKPIWLLKNDRDELVRHIKEESEKFSELVSKTGTCVIDDPHYIFNFISDVSKGITFPSYSSPIDDWIYDFENFRDIIIALKCSFGIDEDLHTKRMKKMLLQELKYNYDKFLTASEEVIRQQKDTNEKENYLNYFVRHFKDSLYEVDGNSKFDFIDQPLSINRTETGYLFLYAVAIPLKNMMRDLKISITEKVLLEGTLLDYKLELDNYDINLITLSLEKIVDWIDSFKQMLNVNEYKTFTNDIIKLNHNSSPSLDKVELSITATVTISALIIHSRIHPLLAALIQFFENDSYDEILKFWKEYNYKLYGT
jgi:hypothetical protein